MTVPSTGSTAISRPQTLEASGLDIRDSMSPWNEYAPFCVYTYVQIFCKRQSIASIRFSKGFLTSKCLPMLKAMVTLCVV